MYKYEAYWVESIEVTASTIVKLANKLGDKVLANFNGIKLEANPIRLHANPVEEMQTDMNTIRNYYSSESSRRAQAWHEYHERKGWAAEKEKWREKMGEVTKLDILDFTDLQTVLAWLEQVQKPSDHEISDRLLIGQALLHGFSEVTPDGVDYIHVIYQVFLRFAKEWRAQFDHE